MERDNVHSACVVAPITESIKSRHARRLRIVSTNQQLDFYNLFSKSRQTRRMCSTLAEAIGLCIIPEGLSITLLPTVLLPRKPNPKTRTLVRKPRIPDQRDWRQRANKHFVSQSSVTDDYNSLLPQLKSSNVQDRWHYERVFYVPRSTFLLLDGILYVLQLTVGLDSEPFSYPGHGD